jgi:hypothetical protein
MDTKMVDTFSAEQFVFVQELKHAKSDALAKKKKEKKRKKLSASLHGTPLQRVKSRNVVV